MNSLDTIRTIVDQSQSILETTTSDTPAELVNKTQPGQANTIGAIYAHAVMSLDMFYNLALQEGTQVFVTSGYAERLGVSDPNPNNWESRTAIIWDISILHSYARAVYDSIHAYLARLTEEELGRTFALFDQDTTVADTIALATWHTALHAGEISALKGVNEVKGLPF